MLLGCGEALQFSQETADIPSQQEENVILHHGRMGWWLELAPVELRCRDIHTLNLQNIFFSFLPPKNCGDRVSQVSEERKEREVKEARR